VRLVALLGVVAALIGNGAHAYPQGCNANLAWQDRFPSWSPDGTTVAFMRQQVGCDPPAESLGFVTPGAPPRLYGTDGRPGSWAPPSWSPEGLAVAYGRNRESIGVTAPTGPVGDDGAGLYPSWAGASIAFTIENEIRVFDLVAGTRRTVLTDYVKPTQSIGMPVWSPDRTKLAIGVMFDFTHGGIAVINADGSGFRIVGEGRNQAVNPTWSPDGRTVAFETNRDGDFEIYSVRLDGTQLRNLTTAHQGDDRMPAWSGDTIAFISNRDRKADQLYGFALFTISPDGSNLASHADDLHPYSPLAWSPDGSQIAFASGRECNRWGIYVFDRRTDDVRRVTNPCRFDGTLRDDLIVGTPFLDIINGGPGRDRLYGRAGADRIYGDVNRDYLDGGPGPDELSGGRSDDVVLGGAGNDHIWTDGRAHDHVYGGSGNDVIDSGSGSRDVITCGGGRDTVRADRLDRVARDCELVTRN
jgi:Ca2+-binding RTX toxin-like protein